MNGAVSMVSALGTLARQRRRDVGSTPTGPDQQKENVTKNFHSYRVYRP